MSRRRRTTSAAQMSTPLAIPEMKVWKPSVIAARISRSSEATISTSLLFSFSGRWPVKHTRRILSSGSFDISITTFPKYSLPPEHASFKYKYHHNLRNDDGDDAQQLSTAKLDALEDVIDSCMEEGKKVIVFARFVPEIDAIARMLRKKNIGYALIKGDVKDRAEQVSAFQTDPDTKVFVGQLQTTGMGLTLTAGSVCVYYSLDFSYANYQQSMARVRRIGQTKRGVYIHLVCKDTIDEKVMGALKQKADVSKLLVDDYKKIIGG